MNEQIALVTGATSGLGYSAAPHLADDGWTQVIVTGRNRGRAVETAAELGIFWG